MRRLVYLSITHSREESFATFMLSEENWQRVEIFWDLIDSKIKSADFIWKKVKIYNDAVIFSHARMLPFIEKTARAGGRNAQLILWMVEKGAKIRKTESLPVLKEFMDNPSEESIVKRDKYIAERINLTLKSGDLGILIIGFGHKHIKQFLPPDIVVEDLLTSQDPPELKKRLTEAGLALPERFVAFLCSKLGSNSAI